MDPDLLKRGTDPSMTPTYRPDVDGLRAIAVLSVIFYHAGSSLLGGGFVGVDVFFVISGFLITTILVREIDAGNFSISRFYERRFRRILPALIVVMAATLLAGALLLSPAGLADLGKSAVATAVFSSNILFYLQSGYFDGPAALKPLLHTWSLAIEEQYYIFFPLLLVAIAKWDSRRYFKWLAALALLSFGACVVVTHSDPSAAFYLIPTRAWELFVGSLVALRALPVPRHRSLLEATALSGAGLIAYSVFGLSADTAFPGAAAALPTLGSALIIHAGIGGQSSVSRVLGCRPLVFIGLISYSLYLWHWPVLVYTRLYSITPPTPGVVALMLSVVFVLSVATWRYVETPFRTKAVFPQRRRLFAASTCALAGMLACGSLIAGMRGLPQRYPGSDADPLAPDPEWNRWTACEKRTEGPFSPGDLCDIGRRPGAAVFLLWGDSHAKALASGVDRIAAAKGVTGKFASRLGCPPLLSIERPSRRSCEDFNRRVLQSLAAHPQITTVLLSARWSLSATGMRYRNEGGQPVRLVDLEAPHAHASNAALLEVGLERTVSTLQAMGRQVVIVKPIPEIGYDAQAYDITAILSGRDLNAVIAPTIVDYAARSKPADAIFRRLQARYRVSFVDPAAALCQDGICKVASNGQLLYRDDDHLSTFGARRAAPAFAPILDAIARRNVRAVASAH